MSFFKKILGDGNQRYLQSLNPLLEAINREEEKLQSLAIEDLSSKTKDFKSRLAADATLDDLLPEAFAVVRETAKRMLGERHYDVQLLGGIILHQGKIAEMKTGEGKTLVSTLPVYLNALAGSGVHVVTVNDYLSRRDAVWMGQIYHALGLSVGVINHEISYLYDPGHSAAVTDAARDRAGSYKVFYEFLRPCSRAEAYGADVTYGTNSEFGFDYLRDHIATDPRQVVQGGLDPARRRGHSFAIVDEVDSVLIDEARTPLIISAPAAESDSLYKTFADLARGLKLDEHYTVDEKMKAISLTEAGIAAAERMLKVDNIYTDKGIKYVHHLETAARAKALFERDRDYVVKDGEVIIVDEFTGRLQPGRRWSEGLHQAIEAKEGVAVKKESRTFASVTLQNYFKLYGKLSGMTGTALTSAEEFRKVYGLETVAVPTHRPSRRVDKTDLIFQTEAGKFQAVARRIKELHDSGQPVLVGTVSIEKNELVSAYLRKAGVPHKILNAKNNEQEGEIIAGAGRKGSVVIATNMAGRGVDIKLGGALASPAEREEVTTQGGLAVIGTERHEARRIDNQLRGRSGRQGDPGVTQFYISLEDTLARVFAPEKIKRMMSRLGIPEDEPIENRLVARAIESAQAKIEGLNFDLRKHLLDYDSVLNHQRLVIYERRQKILFDATGRATRDFLEKVMKETASESVDHDRVANLIAEKQIALGETAFNQSLRQATLQFIDLFWIDHLESMDYLRSSVRLRAYGQRDPLVEYKREGLIMFKQMEARIAEELLAFIPNLGVALKTDTGNSAPTIHTNLAVFPVAGGDQERALAEKTKVGRNDSCPCGSGKKYKKCHGK